MPYHAAFPNLELPITSIVEVTPGASTLADGVTKGLLLSADDTVEVLTHAGQTISIPLAGMVIHRVAVTKVLSASADVFACY